MKRYSSFLALLLFLLLPFGAAAENADPVVVRVGRVAYPLSLAKYSYQSNLDLMAYQGYTPTVAEKEELKRQTIDHLIDLALIENKLIEAGKNDLTDAEETLVRSYAGNVYESLWQGFQQRVKNEGYDVTEEQITSWLTEQGYTLDVVYQEALVNVRYSRIYELYCADVTVTDEDVEAYLQETFVGPDREAYEFDIPRYEREILATGNESFFTPAGYRVIRQILLPYPQAVVDEINALQPAVEEGATALEDAYHAVADAAIAGKDVEAEREAYQAQSQAYADLLNQVVALEQSALPMLKETTDEIALRYAAGESFDSLVAEYGKEAGEAAGGELLFHPESENWAEAFKQAVSALKKPGEITEPFVTDLGIHIVLYQSDLPDGVHELTEEERAALQSSALENKQRETLHPFLDEWKTQYEIETHPEML
ncbi:MAG: peptidylprolyl isomerase [Clostridia bacterium]|nr:peptidylprolyl isomerase [Clostridia bacterium]MBQ6960582.1 peptidylprolyl isomerase [Clostridia bacterium]